MEPAIALYSFAPFSGPNGSATAANVWYMPPTRNQLTTELTYNPSDHTLIASGEGTHLGAGTGTAFPSAGVINCQHFISAAWLAVNANGTVYATTIQGMNVAMKDFSQWVMQGGLGVLVDRWWTGSAWTTKSCTARLEAAKPTWFPGGSMVTIDVSWFCPTARWTEADGTTLTPFR